LSPETLCGFDAIAIGTYLHCETSITKFMDFTLKLQKYAFYYKNRLALP